MKFTASAVLFSLAALTLAADLPACATSCFEKAIASSGCTAEDRTCQCTTGKAAITASATPCVATSCSASDLQAVLAYTDALCKEATESSSSAPASSASSAVSSASAAASSAVSAASSAASKASSAVSKASSVAASASSAAASGASSASSSVATANAAAGLKGMDVAALAALAAGVFAL
ncbi:hypothetical protein EJ06DRAFT_171516 [Trichodelitschia bisporula]|uniref:CFEM domain-containing protein n=1 Tax=Trichodelitschia bisporula TaxID=703511 RepID=A0A6G1HLB3_9PEZI|nr:hypothetical protein EJ06DRAFT_171516 [Trichodelitschia bisporula]